MVENRQALLAANLLWESNFYFDTGTSESSRLRLDMLHYGKGLVVPNVSSF